MNGSKKGFLRKDREAAFRGDATERRSGVRNGRKAVLNIAQPVTEPRIMNGCGPLLSPRGKAERYYFYDIK